MHNILPNQPPKRTMPRQALPLQEGGKEVGVNLLLSGAIETDNLGDFELALAKVGGNNPNRLLLGDYFTGTDYVEETLLYIMLAQVTLTHCRVQKD